MTQMQKLLPMLALILLIIAGCKKEDTNTSNPEDAGMVLSRAFLGGNGIETLIYNGNNAVEGINFTGEGITAAQSYVATITAVDNQGRITQYFRDYTDPARPNELYTISYNGPNGQLSRISLTAMGGGPELLGFSLSYSGNTVTREVFTNGNLNSRQIYTYSSDMRNITEMRSFNSAGVLQTTNTFFDYDDKPNPVRFFPPGYFTAPPTANNARRSVTVNHVTNTTTTNNFTLEYADGVMTRNTHSNGQVFTYEYRRK
jgi:hypothetical protein